MVTGLDSTGRMESGQANWVTIPSLNLGKLISLEIFNDGTGLNGAPDYGISEICPSAAHAGSNQGFSGTKPTRRPLTRRSREVLPTPRSILFPKFTLPLPTIECPAPITVDNAPGKCNTYPVLMLTIYDDDDRIFEALCAGASGYLLKKTPPARLLELLREAVAGGAPCRQSVVALFRAFRPPDNTTCELTPHEIRLLRLFVEGHNYKTAAAELGVTVHTISFHLRSIYEKLQVHSKSEAVVKALRNRLV